MSEPVRSLRPWHYVLLSLPVLGLLWPPLYARANPKMFGIPFFFTYQFAWIAISAGLTAIVYFTLRKER